jgi:hypothetical protein
LTSENAFELRIWIALSTATIRKMITVYAEATAKRCCVSVSL